MTVTVTPRDVEPMAEAFLTPTTHAVGFDRVYCIYNADVELNFTDPIDGTLLIESQIFATYDEAKRWAQEHDRQRPIAAQREDQDVSSDGVTIESALVFDRLGLSVFPLAARSKVPDIEWKPFQSTRATTELLNIWFNNCVRHNAAIVCGEASGVVVIETVTPEAEAWVAANLPPTPMMTQSARGVHRYYRVPTSGPWVGETVPATIVVGDLTIEVKRDGQYVVAPGSVHPSGHVYREVEPWPTSLDAVPEYPFTEIARVMLGSSTTRRSAAPLPGTIPASERNNTLFREGMRLRRLGWTHVEITKSLRVLNDERCQPPLEVREVDGIATSCAKYEPAVDAFPTTEAGDAEYFAACYGDGVRFDHRRGRWLLFNGHHWVPQADGEVYRLALDAVRGRQAAALTITDSARRRERLKWAITGEHRKRLTNLLALAENIKPIADAGDDWDADPWVLGVTNGVVDLQRGLLRAGRPEDRITMCAHAAFHAAAICPVWDQTIGQIFNKDTDLIAYFDRFLGYSLTGDCREETLAFCWGGGANGKGTVMNTIGWLLGDYADDLPFSALELRDRSGIPNDIAKIVGKRFVTSSETGETKRLNEARVKALTGRDPITARFLHREFFTFQPMAKFWLATNHKPIVRDTSVGFWRRIHLIPFVQSFADRPDLQLKDKLRVEADGILARVVRGCLAWQRKGLHPPDVVMDATNAYRTASEPLSQFLDARCVLAPEQRARFGRLFQAYLEYCGDVHEPSTTREFGHALAERFQRDQTDKRYVTYIGVGVPASVDEVEASKRSIIDGM